MTTQFLKITTDKWSKILLTAIMMLLSTIAYFIADTNATTKKTNERMNEFTEKITRIMVIVEQDRIYNDKNAQSVDSEIEQLCNTDKDHEARIVFIENVLGLTRVN